MKKLVPIFLLLFFSTFIYSQSNWDLVWSLDKKPFLDEKTDSELAIVKAGYDTDQDGWGEFLCAWTDKEKNYILMYEASADNTYDLVWYWEYSVRANSFAGIEVGDFDQNGKVEIITTMPTIVTGDESPERIWFFEWTGVVGENVYGKGELGAIEPTRGWNFDLPGGLDYRPYSLTMEDIDKDGANELIVGVRTGSRGEEVMVFSIVGGELFGFGAFQIEYNFIENFQGSLYSVTTGDLDNDGNREIHAFAWANNTVRFIEVTGPDQYQLVTSLDSITTPTDYGALDGVAVVDVNGDGVMELYQAGTEPDNQLFIVTGISDISQVTKSDFNPFYKIPVNALGKLRSLTTADYDGDGNISLLIAGETNGQIFDLEYKGAGDPADSTSWDLNVIFDIYEYSGFSPDSTQGLNTIDPRLFYGSFAEDMDQDGKAEYLFVNYRTTFPVWENDQYLFMIENDQVVGVENPQNVIPNKVNLQQNYPNPFNPSTTITYNLSERSFVELKVFDLLGNEMRTLINSEKEAGSYDINFNASNFASGVYYYTLKTNGMVLTRKMLLLK